jgi:hypothetical protein
VSTSDRRQEGRADGRGRAVNVGQRLAAAVVVGAAGLAAAVMRPGVRQADPATARGWAVGAVTLAPHPSGAHVTAEITNLRDDVREGVFTMVVRSQATGERLALLRGFASGIGPRETRRVDFPGAEDFLARRGQPLRYRIGVPR